MRCWKYILKRKTPTIILTSIPVLFMLKLSMNVSAGIVITNESYVRSRFTPAPFLLPQKNHRTRRIPPGTAPSDSPAARRKLLYGNTLADVGGVVRMALRGINVQIPDELVVDDKSSGFVFARPLRFVHIDVVNQLVQHLPHGHDVHELNMKSAFQLCFGVLGYWTFETFY